MAEPAFSHNLPYIYTRYTLYTWCIYIPINSTWYYYIFRAECFSADSIARDVWGGGGGGTRVLHDRSRMTMDRCIPTMPGRRASGFCRPGRHCLHRVRSAVRCWASRMKGELHLTECRLRGDFSCIWKTASLNRYILWCSHFERQRWV